MSKFVRHKKKLLSIWSCRHSFIVRRLSKALVSPRRAVCVYVKALESDTVFDAWSITVIIWFDPDPPEPSNEATDDGAFRPRILASTLEAAVPQHTSNDILQSTSYSVLTNFYINDNTCLNEYNNKFILEYDFI